MGRRIFVQTDDGGRFFMPALITRGGLVERV
jgi:hypothetical protein